ncbi:MAG: T9SS type A sorting domain-containing protein [Bernardetiaceae bacterium]
MKKQLLLRLLYALLSVGLLTHFSYGQSATCAGATGLCAGANVTFPASTTGAPPAEAGPDYGCLGSQPRPSWFFMQIGTPGTIDLLLTNSSNIDIDFAVWGPFPPGTDPTAACGLLNTPPADCSFAAAATENVNITGTQAGEIFILMITNFNGGATDIVVTQTGGTGALSCNVLQPPNTLFVDLTATGNNDGTSWDNAFVDFQDALTAAASGTLIVVADGTYKPRIPFDINGGGSNAIRKSTFVIPDNVRIIGGFAGGEIINQASIDARDVILNETILSGEIGAPGAADNAYHVVYSRGNSSLLDGFTIRDGNANGTGEDAHGAGWYNDGRGLGINSNPRLSKVSFKQNTATGLGGAFYNNATGIGSANPRFEQTNFWSNNANRGGAFYTDGSTNSTFINCGFAQNNAAEGGALAANDVATTLTVQNSIFWGNTASVAGAHFFGLNTTINYAFSMAQGGITGTGLSHTGTTNNANEVSETSNPFLNPSLGDLRLRCNSTAIDAGGNFLPATAITEIRGQERIKQGSIDLGAFEMTLSNPEVVLTLTENSGNTPNDGNICRGDQVTLSATSTSVAPTTVSLGDEQVSAALPIGFAFDFFGNTYNDFYISSNGFITFSTANGGAGCCSGQNLPSTATPNNLIAFAWEDLDPGNGGQPAINLIRYKTIGVAPNRRMVMEFFNVDHFPSGNRVTAQVMLYEGSNRIEIHTTDMPSDGGNHTMGIENSNGTVAFTVPGRNRQNWSAFNDFVSFTPTAPNTYTIDQTGTFAPITMEASPVVSYLWDRDANGSFGDFVGATITPSPNANTQYDLLAVDVNGCAATLSSTVNVSGPTVSISATSLNINVGTSTTLSATGTGMSYIWTTGATGTSITVSPNQTQTYGVIASDMTGCTAEASVTVSVSGTIPNPPGAVIRVIAPRNLVATGMNTYTIELDWTDLATNEIAYWIYRAPVETRIFEKIDEIGPGTGRMFYYDSINLEVDRRYAYMVLAMGLYDYAASNVDIGATYPNMPSVVATTTGCAGGQASITVAGDHKSRRYRWYADSVGGEAIKDPLSGGVIPYDSAVYLPTQRTPGTYTYYVAALGVKHESKPRLPITVTFDPLPRAEILDSLSSLVSCVSTATLTAAQVDGATYAWSVNDGIPVGTGRVITVEQGGEYRVVVRKNGCVNVSEDKRVRLNFTPAVRLSTPDNLSFCGRGMIAVLSPENAIYGWTRDGNNLGVTEPVIEVTQSGVYQAIVTERGCVGRSVPVRVEIDNPSPGITATLTADNNALCPDERSLLTATAISGASYQWLRDGVPFVRSERNNLTVSAPGRYEVIATLPGACNSQVSSAALTITTLPAPAARLLREGEALVIEVLGSETPTEIRWFYEGEPVPEYTNQTRITPSLPDQKGTYWAFVTYAGGCQTNTNSFRFFPQNNPQFPTGLEEDDKDLILYPNPNNGRFNIRLLGKWTGAMSLRLTDNLGRTIYQNDIPDITGQQSILMSISALASGTYFLQIENEGALHIQKVVKQP